MKKGMKTLLLYLFMIAAVILVVVTVSGSFKPKELTYSEVRDYFKNVQVESFEISNSGVLTMKLYAINSDGTVNYEKTQENTVSYPLFSISFFTSDIYEEFVVDQHDQGYIKTYTFEPAETMPIWVSFLPYIILVVIMIAFWVFFLGKAGKPGGNVPPR